MLRVRKPLACLTVHDVLSCIYPDNEASMDKSANMMKGSGEVAIEEVSRAITSSRRQPDQVIGFLEGCRKRCHSVQGQTCGI